MAKTSTGKPILDLFTHSAEDRVCKGPEDYVLRQVTAVPAWVLKFSGSDDDETCNSSSGQCCAHNGALLIRTCLLARAC